jgi:tetratricopeptide (TPR) repeat protein
LRLRAAICGILVTFGAAFAHAAPDAPAAAPESSDVATPAASAGDETSPAASTAEPPLPVASAPWPPPLLRELPERDPARAAVDRAWRLPAQSEAERVVRTQRAGLALGLRNLDGPARGLIFFSDGGDAGEHAQAAVALAPGLPAAHAALARAEIDKGDLPAAWRALGAALAAAPAHLEARAWLTTASGLVATHAGLGFALLFALLGAGAALPSLSYGLGATRLKLSAPAALAMLGVLVMGLAVAEGPAGAVLGLGALAIASGSATKRIGVVAALAAGVCALHLGFDRIAAGRLLLVADPVAVAVHRVEAGLPTPADLGLALRAAASDLDAASAVALHAKRAGDRSSAAQYFERVLAQRPNAVAYNNAGNVAFATGDVKRAIDLYERATKLSPNATNFYNLSQAYGRAIRLDDQDRALARAQTIDASLVERLTGGSGVGDQVYVSDQSFAAAAVAARVMSSGAPAQLGAIERGRLAPGLIGRELRIALIFTLAVLGLACSAGVALGRAAGPRDFYADLARTLRAGASDSAQRVAQLTRLRTQRARTERLLSVVALVVPGAAGFRFGRPAAALLASAACAAAIAIAHTLKAAPPDPLAVGALPVLLSQLALATLAVVYGLSTAAAFVLRAEE